METEIQNFSMLVRIKDDVVIEFPELLMKQEQYGNLLRIYRQPLLIIFLGFLLQALQGIWMGVWDLLIGGFQRR
jgi:hypothetical protein